MKRTHYYNLADLFYGISLTVLIIFLSGCEFGDTNIDPSTLPDVKVNLLLPSAEAQTARNIASVGSRVTGVVIQHYQGIDAQPLGYNTYLIDENALDDYWRTGLYAGSMKDCALIIKKGQSQNIPHYSGIAKILMAVNLGIATSFWGDVPYSEAFKGQEDLKISYDTQDSIYISINQLLDEAIEELNLPAGDLSPAEDDLIYSGNSALWIGTARALKSRYALHLVKVDDGAASKALDALNGGTIFSNAYEPSFPFGETVNESNPIAYFGLERPNQLALSEYMVNLLDVTNDPRKEVYAVLKNGNYLLFDQGNTDLYWGQFSSPMPLISYSELLFIEAEAHLRLGNPERAETYYQDAIRANMEKVGIEEEAISSFLAAQGDLQSLPSTEAQLQRLIEQKYVAMFGQGTIEAWVDFRRTGYPDITPPSNVSESFDPSKIIPRRYLYPISERQTNTAGVEEAISRQDGHLLDDTLWAYK